MTYEGPQAFDRIHFNGEVLGPHARPVSTLAEASGDWPEVRAAYFRALGVLGVHGTEIARARIVHQEWSELPSPAMAEHVFALPKAECEGFGMCDAEDDGVTDVSGGLIVIHERKVPRWPIGKCPGELALQYDALADPAMVQVVDLQGGHRDGRPRSWLPEELVPALEAALALQGEEA